MIPSITETGLTLTLPGQQITDVSDSVRSSLRSGYRVISMEQDEQVITLMSELNELIRLLRSEADAVRNEYLALHTKFKLEIDTYVEDKKVKDLEASVYEAIKHIDDLVLNGTKTVDNLLIRNDNYIESLLKDHINPVLDVFEGKANDTSKLLSSLIRLGLVVKDEGFVGLKILTDIDGVTGKYADSTMMFQADKFIFADPLDSEKSKIVPFSMQKKDGKWKLLFNGEVIFKNDSIDTSCIKTYISRLKQGDTAVEALAFTQVAVDSTGKQVCAGWTVAEDVTSIIGDYLITSNILVDELLARSAFLDRLAVGFSTGDFGGNIKLDTDFMHKSKVHKHFFNQVASATKDPSNNQVTQLAPFGVLMGITDYNDQSFTHIFPLDPFLASDTYNKDTINEGECYVYLYGKASTGSLVLLNKYLIVETGAPSHSLTAKSDLTPVLTTAVSVTKALFAVSFKGFGYTEYEVQYVYKTYNPNYIYDDGTSITLTLDSDDTYQVNPNISTSLKYLSDDPTYTVKAYSLSFEVLNLSGGKSTNLDKTYTVKVYPIAADGITSNTAIFNENVTPDSVSKVYTCSLDQFSVTQGATHVAFSVSIGNDITEVVNIPVVYTYLTCYAHSADKSTLYTKTTLCASCSDLKTDGFTWFADYATGVNTNASYVELTISPNVLTRSHIPAKCVNPGFGATSQSVTLSVKAYNIPACNNCCSIKFSSPEDSTRSLSGLSGALVDGASGSGYTVATFILDDSAIKTYFGCKSSSSPTTFSDLYSSLTIKAEVSSKKNGVDTTYTDTETLYVANEDPDVFTVVVDNSNVSFVRSASGVVNYAGGGSKVFLYMGSSKLSFVPSGILADTAKLSFIVSAEGENCTAGAISADSSDKSCCVIGAPSNITGVTASVKLKVTAVGSAGSRRNEQNSVISYSIVTDGAKGDSGANANFDVIWARIPVGGCVKYNSRDSGSPYYGANASNIYAWVREKDGAGYKPDGVRKSAIQPHTVDSWFVDTDPYDAINYPCVGFYSNVGFRGNDFPLADYAWQSSKRGVSRLDYEVVLYTAVTGGAAIATKPALDWNKYYVGEYRVKGTTSWTTPPTNRLTLKQLFTTVITPNPYDGGYLNGDTVTVVFFPSTTASLSKSIGSIAVSCVADGPYADDHILDNVALFVHGDAVIDGTLSVAKLVSYGIDDKVSFDTKSGTDTGYSSVFAITSNKTSSKECNFYNTKRIIDSYWPQIAYYGYVDASDTGILDQLYPSKATAPLTGYTGYSAQFIGMYADVKFNAYSFTKDTSLCTLDLRRDPSVYSASSGYYLGTQLGQIGVKGLVSQGGSGVFGSSSGFGNGVTGFSYTGYSGYFFGGVGVRVENGLQLVADNKSYILKDYLDELGRNSDAANASGSLWGRVHKLESANSGSRYYCRDSGSSVLTPIDQDAGKHRNRYAIKDIVDWIKGNPRTGSVSNPFEPGPAATLAFRLKAGGVGQNFVFCVLSDTYSKFYLCAEHFAESFVVEIKSDLWAESSSPSLVFACLYL